MQSLDCIHPAVAAAADGSSSGSSDLLQRLTSAGDIRMPFLGAPWDPKQLYFPRWMFGEWQVGGVGGGEVLVVGRGTEGGGRGAALGGRVGRATGLPGGGEGGGEGACDSGIAHAGCLGSGRWGVRGGCHRWKGG